MSDNKKPQLLKDFLELVPKFFGIQLLVGVIMLAPLVMGRYFGDGWGLVTAITSMIVWLCLLIKLWFYSTIRWVFVLGGVLLLLFTIFETMRLLR